jgi:hypothetical protein
MQSRTTPSAHMPGKRAHTPDQDVSSLVRWCPSSPERPERLTLCSRPSPRSSAGSR